MKYFVLLSFLVVVFAHCYTIKVIPISFTMNKWLGRSKSDVIRSMGPPTSVSDDGAKGEILIYNYTNSVTLRLPTTLELYTTRQIGQYVNFYINTNDKVYYWRTNLPDQRVRVKRGTK